jgi:predicted ArsR family transcriptional regulator
MSRPLGIKARAILSVITDQPATVSGLAARLQLSRQDAFVQVRNLVAAGYVRYGTPIPRAGRPARLVEPICPPMRAGTQDWHPLALAMKGWRR